MRSGAAAYARRHASRRSGININGIDNQLIIGNHHIDGWQFTAA